MPVRNYHFSDQLADSLEAISYFTQDVPLLECYENHYVFVYGTLKRNGPRHEILKDTPGTKWCGVGVTVDDRYDLLINDPEEFNGVFPIAFDRVSRQRDAKIKGEVWLVPTNLLIRLDQIEGNTYMFEREKRGIWVGQKRIMAWVYLGLKGFWNTYTLHDMPMWLDERKRKFHCFDPRAIKDIDFSMTKSAEQEVILH